MTRPIRNREKRAQRKAAVETKRTGYQDHMLQDVSKGLSDWLSSKPEAMHLVRERCAEIEAERDFTLLDGTPLNPASPWPTGAEVERK